MTLYRLRKLLHGTWYGLRLFLSELCAAKSCSRCGGIGEVKVEYCEFDARGLPFRTTYSEKMCSRCGGNGLEPKKQ